MNPSQRIFVTSSTGRGKRWFHRLFERAIDLFDLDLDHLRHVASSLETSRLEIVSALGSTPQAYGWESRPSCFGSPRYQRHPESITPIQPWERSGRELRTVVRFNSTPVRRTKLEEVGARGDRVA